MGRVKSEIYELSGNEFVDHDSDSPFSAIFEKNPHNKFDETLSVIPDDFTLMGYAVKPQLQDFFSSQTIETGLKERLQSHLKYFKNPELLAVTLAVNSVSCNKLVEDAIASGTNAISNFIPHTYKIIPSVDHKTLTAKHLTDENALAIFVNPLFASTLEPSSLSDALAHEAIHHRGNHYVIMTDAISEWLKHNNNAPDSRKLEIRPLAERAIDCVANDIVGAHQLRIKDGENLSNKTLLSAAILFGGRFQRDEKGFYIPLYTVKNTNDRYHINVLSTDGIKHIFEQLVLATE